MLNRRDRLLALLTVLIWGINFLAMKQALTQLPPFQLGALRFFLAAFPLVLFLPRPPLPWSRLILFGCVQGVAQFGLLFWAMSIGMPAGLASVVMQTQAFFTLLLGAWFLHEHFQRHQLVGLVVATSGMFVLGLSHGYGMPLAGFLLTLASGLAWASSNILARHTMRGRERIPVLPFIAWTSLCAVPPFLLLSLLIDGTSAWRNLAQVSWPSWGSLLFLAWASTLLAYSLWTHLLWRHPANRIAPFSLLVPTVGLSTAAMLFHEYPTPLQWFGSALVLAGLAINFGLSRIK